MQEPLLYIVIPCYNEQEVLPITCREFKAEIELLQERGKIAPDSKILFVDDGSRDRTWSIIEELSREDPCFTGIKLSRNRGHQNALMAGLMEAKDLCDICISIDCDGQDDIGAMEEMVDAYLEGCDVVYGVRSKRTTDTAFKRGTAESFYKLMRKMGVETIDNHADYRLLSRRVLEELSNYKEVNLFLRGMIPLVGFRSTSVFYERHERIAGESHYPLKKMLGLAIDGITSLSTKPLSIVCLIGIAISFLSLIGIVWSIVIFCLGDSVSGWSSIVAIICFMGGAQLAAIGVVGEYVGKIYMEAKGRPRWIIERRTDR